MRKFFVLMSFVYLSLCSCTSVKTLQGNYANSYSITTATSYDKVWDNVIDYFASNGISISTMEKASGLIVANRIVVPQTIEKNGKPLDSSAFIVIPNVNKYPSTATASFNVRVKNNGDSVTITVNVYNIESTRIIAQIYYNSPITEPIEGKSTGVFEKGLLNLFK